jgi:hypothetical protein
MRPSAAGAVETGHRKENAVRHLIGQHDMKASDDDGENCSGSCQCQQKEIKVHFLLFI